VWPLIESGAFRPVIDRTFPLAQAAEAHAHLEAGDHLGKVVLTV
jgi:NADPH:quinone reductase-like Zn-dependent oxidoreductase